MRDGRDAAGVAGLEGGSKMCLAATPVRRAAAWAALALLLQLAACDKGAGGGNSGSASAAASSAQAASASQDSPPVAVGPAPAGYRLVWADEFDVPGLPDPARWAYDTVANKTGWYNNELQYYASERPENAVVSGGTLRITARLESLKSASDWGGQRYTSARLLTQGKASWTYGFIEVRAKMPCGRGTWPALWTMGVGGAWPDDGEVDIVEHVGRDPTRVAGTVHTLQSGGHGTGAAIQVADACTAFHNYQMHWTAERITLGLDGTPYYTYTNPREGKAVWPFDAAQFLLMNVAVGGTLGGPVDDSIFPVTMEIDHVRVWQAPH